MSTEKIPTDFLSSMMNSRQVQIRLHAEMYRWMRGMMLDVINDASTTSSDAVEAYCREHGEPETKEKFYTMIQSAMGS